MAIISQGKFTSNGQNKSLAIRSDVDWMWVYNYTAAGANGALNACATYWQRGMDAGTGITYNKVTGGSKVLSLDVLAANGFTLYDNSLYTVGNAIAVTSTTNATQPVVATGSTAGLGNVGGGAGALGGTVRLSSVVNNLNICGIDFDVDTVVANTSFRIMWALANAPGSAGGAGFWRLVPNEPQFAPRRRFIANITLGATTTVRTTVRHGYSVGEMVRFYIPDAVNGTVQLNNVQGPILSVDLTTNQFVVDIDSSGFTTFAWPTFTVTAFTPAQCEAFGSVAANNLTLLDDAVRNEATIGMILGGGAGAPAGANNDVIYWVAGKSDVVNTTT